MQTLLSFVVLKMENTFIFGTRNYSRIYNNIIEENIFAEKKAVQLSGNYQLSKKVTNFKQSV